MATPTKKSEQEISHNRGVLTNKAIEANDGKPLPLIQKAPASYSESWYPVDSWSNWGVYWQSGRSGTHHMQADTTLPAAQKCNYSNSFHALYRIAADEGVLALWKGAAPTVVRAMALNMDILASYDQSVEFFKDSGFGEEQVLPQGSLHLLAACP